MVLQMPAVRDDSGSTGGFIAALNTCSISLQSVLDQVTEFLIMDRATVDPRRVKEVLEEAAMLHQQLKGLNVEAKNNKNMKLKMFGKNGEDAD